MVFEYCSRGSLRDILNSDDLQLDWAFKESLLMDLIKVIFVISDKNNTSELSSILDLQSHCVFKE